MSRRVTMPGGYNTRPVASTAGAFGPLVVLAMLASVAASCATSERPVTPPTRVRVSTGPSGGGFRALGDALAPAMSRRLTGVELVMEPSRGAVDNLQAVARRERECAFTYADVAFEAFAGGRLAELSSEMADVRALGVLEITPVQLIARRGSGIRSLADLRGKRVAVGGPGTATSLVGRLLLDAFEVRDEVVITPVSLQDVPQALEAGALDAVFDTATYSQALALALEAGATLVPIDGAPVERLRGARPFMRTVMIPEGTYGREPATPTIGLESVLVCHRAVEDSLGRQLTSALVDALQDLARAGRWNLVPLQELPAAPIPLHPGAAVYYRESELQR